MSGSARIELRGITKRFGETVVLHGIDLSIAPGEFFSLLGPSGCGKTTTLRIIAGLETPDAGRVHVDGRDITDTSPGERDAAMVFQSYALYPHMTVAGNIGFLLRMVGTRRSEIERLVMQAARRVGIELLLLRRPGQLSGGQQQRVALARAIVRSPRLFLLDEPLSNLDAKLRMQTRTEVKQLQRALGVTTIYVTHDQEEAMSLSDRMAIFVDGRIVQIGTPEEVFGKPASTAVAGFLGSPPMNLLPARLCGAMLEIEGHRLELPRPGGDEDRAVVAGIRPGDITIREGGLPATVELAEPQGESVIVDLRFGAAALKARIFSGVRFREGQEVQIGIDPARVHLFNPDGQRLDEPLEPPGGGRS
jgi:ABC-type sugar transport system ATPase subunit